MKEYVLPIKSIVHISENVLSVTIDSSGSDFSFKSGQYIAVRIIDPVNQDYKNNTRSFSIVNPPHIKDEISIVMRLSGSGFSVNMLNAKPGMKVAVSSPMGNLHLEKNKNISDVFIAGGVGVTPFRSMINDLLYSGHENEILLFYSNRSKNAAAFLEEFILLAEKHSNFKFIPIIDDVSDSEWKYEKGFINSEMLNKYIEDFSKPVFHIVGPPQMVDSIITILQNNRVTDQNIRTEKY